MTLSLALLVVAIVAAGCARPESLSSTTSREDTLRQIAADYVASGDLAAAQASLDKLKVANPAQLLVSLAEGDVAAGRAAEEIKPLADLAAALGTQSPKLVAFFAPTAEPTEPPTNTPVPPTATSQPTDTSIPPTATAEQATATSEPATGAPEATPQAIANGTANVRSGPGRNYPVIGRLSAGQQTDVIGRNASGDWWRLAWPGKGQAWVSGTTVRLQGPIDTVAVAKDIPTPPPVPTRAPQPTAAPTEPPAEGVAPAPTSPPAAQPKPGVQYVVQSVRLRPVNEGAQRCDGGDHNIFVSVLDAGGNPVDGVRVREVFSGQINVTGAQGKGPGRVEYDIYRGGGGQLEIVDEGNNRIGELTRGMSADWPDFDMIRAAGYCNCKPHPDDASCESDLVNKQYLFAVGHYVYEVVFRRTW